MPAPPTPPKPRAKPWITLVVVLALLVGAAYGFRMWKTALENAPVDESFRNYLEYVAERSPAAALHLQRYYTRYQRTTVASRHFQPICASVTALAERDKVDLRLSDWHTLAKACRRPLGDDEIHFLP